MAANSTAFKPGRTRSWSSHIRATSAPSASTAETWFGPKPPLDAKLDPRLKLTRVEVTPASAIAPTPAAGAIRAAKMRVSSALDTLRSQNTNTHTISAKGPDRLKLSCLRAASHSRLLSVMIAEGSRRTK